MHVTPVMTRALALRAVAVLTLAAVSATAALSEPTAAQRNAIRSACRGDVQINCGGLRPDGAGALECLQENVGHLSPACRAAVNLTIDGAQAGPAAPSPPPAFGNIAPVAPAPPPPASSDRPKPKPVVAAPSPPAPAAKQEAAQPTPKQEIAEKHGKKEEKKAGKKPELSVREEVKLLRQPCGRELTRFCGRIRAGANRWTACLKPHERQLSRTCRTALAKASAKD